MRSAETHLRLGAFGRGRRTVRRGFTLAELVIAGVITAFVLGSVTMSVTQLSRARDTSKLRFDAYMRADYALNMIRREVAAVLRRDDLFFTRLLLIDDHVRVNREYFERDGILIFNSRLRAVRDIDFNGEGFEYETQFRIEDDEMGPVLWVRHDAVPDEYPFGGGVVSPCAEGILGLMFEAYDGYGWYQNWDSDMEGLPLAIRITIVASGHRDSSDIYTAPRAMLRTVVSIDRVIPPKDLFKDPEDEDEDEEAMEDEAGSDEDPFGQPSDDRDRGGGGGGGGNVDDRPDGGGPPTGPPTGGPGPRPRGPNLGNDAHGVRNPR